MLSISKINDNSITNQMSQFLSYILQFSLYSVYLGNVRHIKNFNELT